MKILRIFFYLILLCKVFKCLLLLIIKLKGLILSIINPLHPSLNPKMTAELVLLIDCSNPCTCIDALHNSAFLFPVARKRGYGCISFKMAAKKIQGKQCARAYFDCSNRVYDTNGDRTGLSFFSVPSGKKMRQIWGNRMSRTAGKYEFVTTNPKRVVSSYTGAQGNSHCIFFVWKSLVRCSVLFGLLYRLLCTATRGQNPNKDL